jgi:copper transport protein
MKLFTLGVLLLACWVVWPSSTADAHSQLVETLPAAGAQLTQSPDEIRLTFNEAVETKVGGIELLDSLSRKLKVSVIEANRDRTSIAVKPPKLDEGVYTVTYRIISEDGHPVNGSYVFVVGSPPAARDAETFNLHTQLGHSGHEHGTAASALTSSELVLYAVRFFYYAALLLATGIMLWRSIARFQDGSVQLVEAWSLGTIRAFLFGSILYVFFHAREVMQDEPLSEWLKLLLRTSVGTAWLATVVLSLLGFIALRGGRAVRIIWAILLIAVESWSGHAEANNPKVLTVGLDFVHLAAAAIWAGGLALLLALWFKDRKEAGRFSVRFSGGAVLSLAALVLTGAGMTLLFLPKLSYLWLTSWGVMLTIKAGLALLVIVAGAMLRIRVKRGDLPAAGILKADGVLMALIILITSLFTYVSPLPANEPVAYHEMGSEMHYSLRVMPNVPGDNTITLKIWLPDQTGAPKSVVLRFRSEQHADAPIDIPLEAYDDKEIDAFDGYGKYTYQASGPYIPYPGKWTAEIRVMDKNDNELVKQTIFRNY